MPYKPPPPRVKVKSEKGFPVVAGFLSALILFGYCVAGLLGKGILWPLKYPDKGMLTLPAAIILMLGAALVFIHGLYFLFVLPPSAGPERPRTFFRILNWVGLLMVLGAGFVPDDALEQIRAYVAR
jgi:hypothetical protein